MLLLQILQLWPPFQFQKAKNRALDMSSSLCMFKTFSGFPSQIPDYRMSICYKEGQRLSHYNPPFLVYMEEEEKDFDTKICVKIDCNFIFLILHLKPTKLSVVIGEKWRYQ